MNQTMIVELERKTVLAAGGESHVFNLSGLPAGRRVRNFVFLLSATATDGASGGPAFKSGKPLADLISFAEHRSAFLNVRATGDMLRRLYHAMNGRAQSEIDFAATSGAGTKTVNSLSCIPCADQRSVNPDDGAIPCEFLNGTTIAIKTAALGPYTGGGGLSTAFSAMTLTLAVELAPADAVFGDEPLKSRIDYEDWAGQTVELKAGAYSHLLVMHADGTTIETAEIERADMSIEGNPVIDNIRTELLVDDYNRKHVGGGFTDNDRENLNPGTYYFLPVITPPDKYRVTDCPWTDKPATAKLTFSGTDTAVRVVYRLFEPKSSGLSRKAAQSLGKSGGLRALSLASGKVLGGDTRRVRFFDRVLPAKLK